MSTLSNHASAMPPAPMQPHSAGEPRLKKLRLLHVAVRPQVRATRQASSTNRCAVTPFRFMASLRTMKMACSKSSVSGESTTITLRDVPLTILKAAPPDGKTFCLQYARRGGRYTGRAKIFAHSNRLRAARILGNVERQNTRVVRAAALFHTVGQNRRDKLLWIMPLPAREQVLQPLVV